MEDMALCVGFLDFPFKVYVEVQQGTYYSNVKV